MSVPVIALTNASTCLSDAQVETVMPSLQRQPGFLCVLGHRLLTDFFA
jgi:hypothetical protein